MNVVLEKEVYGGSGDEVTFIEVLVGDSKSLIGIKYFTVLPTLTYCATGFPFTNVGLAFMIYSVKHLVSVAC